MSKKRECLRCGRRLQKFWQMVMNKEHLENALEVKQVYDWQEVFQGNYGYLGNNHFCTKSCGFYWALDRLDSKTQVYK